MGTRWYIRGRRTERRLCGKAPRFYADDSPLQRGKIDLIITKSISRFARNTLDSIGYVRKLKAMGVGVLFEKENINTLEENSEVVLTILASLAQEELNSLSCNVKMGKRMAMQEGKVVFQYKRMYAYQKELTISPKSSPSKARSSNVFLPDIWLVKAKVASQKCSRMKV